MTRINQLIEMARSRNRSTSNRKSAMDPRKERRESILPDGPPENPSVLNTPEELKRRVNEKPEEAFAEIRKLFMDHCNLHREYASVLDERNDFFCRLEELKSDDRTDDEVYKLKLTVEILQEQLDINQRKNTSEKKPNKSVKLPDPPKFLGNGELSVEDWLVLIRGKLSANADLYDSEEIRMTYVLGLVGGKAANHLRPRTRKGATDRFEDADEMLDLLEERYKDSNRLNTATIAFRKLYQNKSTFRDFWVEFLSLTAELDMTQETLIIELRNRMNRDLSRQFLADESIKTVYDLARKCQLYEDNEKALPARRDADTAKTTIAFRSGQATVANKTRTGTETTVKKLDSPYTFEERQVMKTEGKCYKCGVKGHIATTCTAKPAGPVIKAEIAELSAGNDNLLEKSSQE